MVRYRWSIQRCPCESQRSSSWITIRNFPVEMEGPSGHSNYPHLPKLPKSCKLQLKLISKIWPDLLNFLLGTISDILDRRAGGVTEEEQWRRGDSSRAADWRFIFKTLTECLGWQLNGTLALRIFEVSVNFFPPLHIFDGLLTSGCWMRVYVKTFPGCFVWQFNGTLLHDLFKLDA